MSSNLIAEASTTINASRADVWNALVNPKTIKQYMFGTTVVSDWQEGSPIVWKGEWQGKPYEDKGVLLQVKPEHTLAYTHFSPLAGLPDTPENYHTVTIDLSGTGTQTRISLTQDTNGTEQERDEAAKNWGMMLSELKKVVEQ